MTGEWASFHENLSECSIFILNNNIKWHSNLQTLAYFNESQNTSRECDPIQIAASLFPLLWVRFFLTWLRFFLPWLRFFCACPSVVMQMPGQNSQRREHGPHSSTLVAICVVRLLFMSFCVLFVCKCVLPPGDNPIAVNKYIIWNSQYCKSYAFVGLDNKLCKMHGAYIKIFRETFLNWGPHSSKTSFDKLRSDTYEIETATHNS